MTTATDPFGLQALRALVPQAEAQAPGVSGWSVGQHVEHCVLAMLGIGRAVLASTPPPPRDGRWLLRRAMLLLRRLPRGRGQAPEAVVPRKARTPEELAARLDEAQALLQSVAAADAGAWFRHFAFGVLRRDQALAFLAIHNRHHARIARDVLRARPR